MIKTNLFKYRNQSSRDLIKPNPIKPPTCGTKASKQYCTVLAKRARFIMKFLSINAMLSVLVSDVVSSSVTGTSEGHDNRHFNTKPCRTNEAHSVTSECGESPPIYSKQTAQEVGIDDCDGDDVVVERKRQSVTYYCYSNMVTCHRGKKECTKIPYRNYDVSHRSLQSNVKYLDLVFDNEIGVDRSYYLEILPSGGSFWNDNPWGFWYDDATNEAAFADHSQVVKGGSTAVTVQGGDSVETFNNIKLNNFVSTANAQIRWFKTYELTGLSGNYASLTFIGHPGDTLTLTNTEAICAGPITEIGFSLTVGELVQNGMSISQSIDPCQTNYVSCGDPFTIATAWGTQPAQTCSMTLYNRSEGFLRALFTGVSIS